MKELIILPVLAIFSLCMMSFASASDIVIDDFDSLNEVIEETIDDLAEEVIEDITEDLSDYILDETTEESEQDTIEEDDSNNTEEVEEEDSEEDSVTEETNDTEEDEDLNEDSENEEIIEEEPIQEVPKKKHKDGGCVTKWDFNYETGEWFKEDWVHPALKKIIAEKGTDSPEYEKFKNKWKTLDGKYCVAVDEKGKKMAKPTSVPEDYNKISEVNDNSNLEESKEPVKIELIKKEEEKLGFWQRLKNLFFS